MFRVKSGNDISIHDFIRLPFFTYSISGLKLFEWEGKYKNTQWNIILLLLMLVNGISLLCAMLCYVVIAEYDVVELTEMFIFMWFGVNSLFKAGSIWIRRDLLRKALSAMKSTTYRRIAADAHKEFYLLSNKRIRNLFVSYFSTTAIIWALPVVQSTIEYYGPNGQYSYRLPYPTIYPFDTNHPLTYIIAFFNQMMTAVGSMSFFVGSDSLLISTVYLLNMHFTHLLRRIERLMPDINEKSFKKLAELLEFHSIVLDYSEDINNVFSFSILMNYVISVMEICLISFQVATGASLKHLIAFTLFFLISMYANFIVCSVGTELFTLSSDVADALCIHPWYNANLKYQRLLPLAIARSQRPACLTAFKFFIISMETFKTMMTTSYQFFTLLRTYYDESADI